ncbi:MAG: alpha/beta hydrolase [Thermococcus sp.]|nr:alpha/beta hydrolase [Thermococcus sp.]
MEYVCDWCPSPAARLTGLVLGIVGMKKRVEKKILTSSFRREPAEPPKALFKKYRVEIAETLGRKVWTLSKKGKEFEKVVLYLHGGAYVANISREHWNLIEKLLDATGWTVVVPDYPLAPEHHYKDTYKFMEALYSRILGYSPSRMVFMGDSAGGGLALGFTQYLRDKGEEGPEQVVLFSPWLDVTMSNPAIRAVEKKDKILSVEALRYAGMLYAGELDPRDYRVSPLYGDFRGLGLISIFTGTHDILNPDARKCRVLMERQGVSFAYFEYPGLLHDWMLFPWLKESKDAVEKVRSLLKRR